MRLCAAPRAAVVEEDGSPCARKRFAMWNAPLIDEEGADGGADEGFASSGQTRPLVASSEIGFGGVQGPRRKSPVNEAALLLSLLIKRSIRTLAFVKARNVCELLLRKTQEQLPAAMQGRVAAYRAGYTAADRREIERGLRSGSLTAVVATNALELGIDIDGISTTLHLGHPGSAASLRQQMGRAGRAGGDDSLAIMICLDAPLDQSFVAAQQEGGAGSAGALIDPTTTAPLTVDISNRALLSVHLEMAAAESVLRLDSKNTDDSRLFGSAARATADGLVQKGTLQRASDGYTASAKRGKIVGLRGINGRTWRVVHNGAVLEEVEQDRAMETLFAGAILMHRGQKYIVTKSGVGDADSGRQADVEVERCSVDYYTEAQTVSQVHGTQDAACQRRVLRSWTSALGSDGRGGDSPLVEHGPVRVAKTVHSYRRRRAVDRKVMDSVDLFQPPAEHATEACWLVIPPTLEREVHSRGWSFERGGLHAMEHALIAVAPAHVRLEPEELGCQCRRVDIVGPATKHLLVYEKHHGGVGLAAQLAARAEPLLQSALHLMERCPCDAAGCPSCVHMATCEEHNQRLHKTAGVYMLRRLLGASTEAAALGL